MKRTIRWEAVIDIGVAGRSWCLVFDGPWCVCVWWICWVIHECGGRLVPARYTGWRLLRRWEIGSPLLNFHLMGTNANLVRVGDAATLFYAGNGLTDLLSLFGGGAGRRTTHPPPLAGDVCGAATNAIRREGVQRHPRAGAAAGKALIFILQYRFSRHKRMAGMAAAMPTNVAISKVGAADGTSSPPCTDSGSWSESSPDDPSSPP